MDVILYLRGSPVRQITTRGGQEKSLALKPPPVYVLLMPSGTFFQVIYVLKQLTSKSKDMFLTPLLNECVENPVLQQYIY